VAGHTCGDLPENDEELSASGVVGGNEIKHIDQRHGIPTHGAAPEMRGGALFGMGPLLFPALIPTVVIQPALRIKGMPVDNGELVNHIIEGLRFTEVTGKPCVKGCPHI